MEETAYAVQALTRYHSNIENIDTAPISRGAHFLSENYYTDHYPELWIGKALYVPTNIVKSTIISALYLYHDQIEKLSETKNN
jgi:hypothetical protein